MAQRRYNPLLDEWVLVSPERTQRPWQGQIETAAAPTALEYDPHCYLCPGNARAGAARNPAYTGTFVFDNDYPALTPAANAPLPSPSPLLRAEAEGGLCRVVCFSPRHDLTLPYLGAEAVTGIIGTWVEQYRELAARPGIRSVMIFENRGAMMGASNPHPHGQIWANAHLPNLVGRELAALALHRQRHGACLLCDYAALELERGERVVAANAAFVAVVPYWAVWPFEVLLVSRDHTPGLVEVPATGRRLLAEILIRVQRGYDRLFQTPFPQSWGFHLPPADGSAAGVPHLHAHFLPPLLRSATVRKFMVGYELLATPQRDLTPEQAAERLRQVMDGRSPETSDKDGPR